MMSVVWSDLQRIFEISLDFLLDLMRNGNYEQETISQVIEKYLPDYDLSKGENGPSLAYSLAERYIRQDSRFRFLLNSPEIYGFLKNIQTVLSTEQAYPEDDTARAAGRQVSQALHTLSQKLVNRRNLILLADC